MVFGGAAAKTPHRCASSRLLHVDVMQSPELNSRQREILMAARRDGEVSVDSLAVSFDVTPQTIRRDLNVLCLLRLLRRTHGGARASDGVSNLGYGARKVLAAQAKSAIGRYAAGLIPNDSSLFVNIGTTTEQVAHHLAQHVGLLVITNNINVVNLLRPVENVQIMIAGGTVRRSDGGVVGNDAVEFIANFRVDHAVIGASAIEEDGVLLDFDAQEVRVARAIIANARSVVLVADATKFERTAPVRIADLSSIDNFVTDAPPPKRFMEACRAADVVVHVVSDGACC